MHLNRFVTAAGSNIAFKIADKPLQIETWLLLTAYRKLPLPYLGLLSPTFYDLPFSYNRTCVTDRQTTNQVTTYRSSNG